jgi:4-alpha-glucanotransferase
MTKDLVQRVSGILLHPTSFPGPYAIGDLGPEAYAFIDFLVTAGQSLWQVLPLGPTGYGDSPIRVLLRFRR